MQRIEHFFIPTKPKAMKRITVKLLISIWVITLLFSCSNGKKVDTSSDIFQEIQQRSENYFDAVRSENTDSILSYWSDDLRVIGNQQDIIGKDALRQFLEMFYSSTTVDEISILGRDIDVSDMLAVEVVEYSELVSSNNNQERTIQGKQIQVWKKENGEWRILRMAFIPKIAM